MSAGPDAEWGDRGETGGPSPDRDPGSGTRVNRRDHARSGAALAVTLTAPDGTRVTGSSADVSLGGVFVSGCAAPPPGTDCQVELSLGTGPARVAIHLQGRVARVTEAGAAVQYTYIDADNHARLHELFASGTVRQADEPDGS